MEEWKEYKEEKLGNYILDIAAGPFGSNLKVECFVPDGFPIIDGANLKEFKVTDNVTKFVTEEKARSLHRSIAKRNDVVVTISGNVGQISYIPMDSKYEEYLVSQRQFRATFDSTKVYVPYLVYFFHTQLGQHKILSFANQTGVPALAQPLKNFKNIDICLPNISLQKQIASILKSLDDKIEVNRKINENLEQQAQALFKSWLKKCEDEVTIGDLSLNITDYTKCEQKQVVLINSSDVTEGRFEHHNLSENKNLKGHFKKRFQIGDILYSQVRPRNRHWGYCTFNADIYLASTQLMVIRNKANIISSILLYQYIIDDNVWMDFTLKTETRSGTFPQGNYEDLSSIKVPFGADTEEISKNLESIYSIIYNNETESRRLAELRDTLLPKLMSGELKVNEIEV